MLNGSSEMKVKIKRGEVEEESAEELLEPVSPTGQYFSIPPSICIVAVFEFENPVDDSNFAAVIMDTFPRINPRFTSIMVEENGEKQWKRVALNVHDHIKIPRFPDGLSPEAYDAYFSDYISSVGMDPFPPTRPLWELHVFKYPTTNAPGTAFFKLHHALGDGFSLMGVLLSCLERADDPSVPLSFPKFRVAPRPENGLIRNLVNFVPHVLSGVQNTVLDFTTSVLKSTLLEDDVSPIRSGGDGVEFKPMDISTLTFELDHVKKIKDNLKVTLNDVISGVVFLGTRLYMESTMNDSGNGRATSVVLLNTRMIDGYKSVDDMLHNPKSKHLWGNQFGFIHVSVPKLHDPDHSINPLKFVYESHEMVKRKRNSWAVPLIGILLQCIRKYGGAEMAAKFLNRTQRNVTMGLTSMVGPIDKISACNQPIKGFYATVFNVPQSYKVSVMSYMNHLRLTLCTERGVIDPHKLKRCIQEAYEMISKEAL